jgi:hypothetical protein
MLGSLGQKLQDIYVKGKDIVGEAFEGTGFDDPLSQYGAQRFEVRAVEKKEELFKANHPVGKLFTKINLRKRLNQENLDKGNITKEQFTTNEEVLESDEQYTMEEHPLAGEYFDQLIEFYHAGKKIGESIGDTRVYNPSRRTSGSFDMPLLSQLGDWIMGDSNGT